MEERGERGRASPHRYRLPPCWGLRPRARQPTIARDFTSACTEPRDWPEAKHFTGVFSECDPALALDVAFKTPQ